MNALPRHKVTRASGTLDAGTARVDLAVPAFEDPPVGS